MKPIEFKHQNVVFAKNQPEYMPLPALKLDTPQAEVISCWKMSFRERIKVLFTGCIWVSLMSFNKPLTPSYISVNRKDVYSHTEDSQPKLNMKNLITKFHKKSFMALLRFIRWFIRLYKVRRSGNYPINSRHIWRVAKFMSKDVT
jgi:hypothetical protein